MTKMERVGLLRNLKPLTWYLYCQMEAFHDEEVLITKQDLALKLNVSPQSITKYLNTWEAHGLVRKIAGGYMITQLDGEPSKVTADPVVREFKNARDIINYWCDIYKEAYGQPYMVTNWIVTQTHVKKLLRYSDEEIRSTFQAIISLYERQWAKPAYPRPTLGAVCSWLFVQAEPYAVKAMSEVSPENTGSSEGSSDLLNELEAKGWL